MRFSMVCSVKAALRSACWIFCTLAHELKNLDEDCRLLSFRLIRPAVCEIRGKTVLDMEEMRKAWKKQESPYISVIWRTNQKTA